MAVYTTAVYPLFCESFPLFADFCDGHRHPAVAVFDLKSLGFWLFP